jgi:threonine/homoserine/homoserine lactone efflux protein
MDIIWEGLKLGLLLTIMVGPIFFAIIQTGVEEGFVAAATVGLGIWISDLIYILFVYFGISYAAELLQNQTFTYITGSIGGGILIVIGIATFRSKPPTFDRVEGGERRSSFSQLFTRGFLINSINPFTIFFWFSVTSTMVVNDTFQHHQAFLFFGTILLTIMCTDMIKALLAKRISNRMTQRHIQWSRKITGVILAFFGVALLVRVFLIGQ